METPRARQPHIIRPPFYANKNPDPGTLCVLFPVKVGACQHHLHNASATTLRRSFFISSFGSISQAVLIGSRLRWTRCQAGGAHGGLRSLQRERDDCRWIGRESTWDLRGPLGADFLSSKNTPPADGVL